MLVVFENENIYDDIGSDTAKIQFLQAYPLKAHFGSKSTSFHSAGLFQLKDGPPILVLPWFLKDYYDVTRKELDIESTFNFFEAIKEIKTLLAAKTSLDASATKFIGVDLICYSFLINLKVLMAELMSHNYHEEITESSSTIKGKWHINKDLSRGPKPIKFTCTFGSLEKDTAFFKLVKSACLHLRNILKSNKNLILVDDILNLISDVSTLKISKSLLLETKFWIRSHKKEPQLSGVVSFIENIFFERDLFALDAGLCFQFSMDKFFEDLIFRLVSNTENLNVLKQMREDLLGGASWVNRKDAQAFQENTKNAIQKTIPDVVASNSTDHFIFECKYKPLRVPYINNEDPDQSLDSFSRNDRNQLLSFVLSLAPSAEMQKKNVNFVVVFPSSFVTSFKISELRFDNSELQINDLTKSVIQHRDMNLSSKNLRIKFLAVNIPYALQECAKGSSNYFEEIIVALKDSSSSTENVAVSAEV